MISCRQVALLLGIMPFEFNIFEHLVVDVQVIRMSSNGDLVSLFTFQVFSASSIWHHFFNGSWSIFGLREYLGPDTGGICFVVC